jgi:hypothetical protein
MAYQLRREGEGARRTTKKQAEPGEKPVRQQIAGAGQMMEFSLKERLQVENSLIIR